MSAELMVIASLRGGEHDGQYGQRLRAWVTGRFPDAEIMSLPGAAIAVSTDQTGAGTSSESDDRQIRTVVAVTEHAMDIALHHQSPSTLGFDGGHIAVTVRPAVGTVTLTNDGLGSIPFYWIRRDQTFVGATRLGALVGLGVPLAWDELALAQYLALLHPLGDRTLLRGVSCLPAGARLTVTPTATTLSSEPLFAPQVGSGATDDEALDRFAGAWRDALTGVLDRTGEERLAVALSGGLDSRAVVSGMVDLGASPLTFTYGGPEQREVQVARSIADRLHLAHLELPIGETETLADPESIAAALDGVHCPAEFYDRWFLGGLRQSFDVMVSGLWGGPLWGGDKSFGLSSPDEIAAAYLTRIEGSLESAARFITGWSAGDVGSAVRDDAIAGLARWEPRADLSVFWNVDNRQRRWGLAVPTAMARSGIRVEAPFLTGGVVASLAALTAEQRRYGRLHLLAHTRLFPDLADIPRGNDGNAPRALNHVYWSGDRTIPRQLWELGRSHPLSAARRLRTQGAARLVAVVPGRRLRTRLRDRIATREEVFPAGLLVRDNAVYRARLADYLEQSIPALPARLSAAALQSAVEELRGPTAVTFNPLVAARAATVGTWARLWSTPLSRPRE